MISVDEARKTILSYMNTLSPEQVTLWDARGRVLAEDVMAGNDVPPFRNSAMDGYAVIASDVQEASTNPVYLSVIGDVAAGAMPERAVQKGEAVRIMTGAPMPDGADAVVRFEETSEAWEANQRPHASSVAICNQIKSWDNVRAAGEDLQKGQLVIPAGMILRPAHIGVMASLGVSSVSVIRRPRVAILATGDELVPADAPLAPGKIRNSNEYTKYALVEQLEAVPVPLGIARDTVESLSAKLQEGLDANVDLFLTSAGVSVGDYDMVKDVLAAEGEMSFWQVGIKPGKPLAFGLLRHQGRQIPLLGLPGNPVAAMVAFHAFARPSIRLLGGRTPLLPPIEQAEVCEDITNSGRRHYMRALVRRDTDGKWKVTTRGSGVRVQGSGILSSMVWANCFVVVPEGVSHLPEGSMVNIEMLNWSD